MIPCLYLLVRVALPFILATADREFNPWANDNYHYHRSKSNDQHSVISKYYFLVFLYLSLIIS